MAAKIGILGECTLASSGTVTLYTVPADKAARVRIAFFLQNTNAGAVGFALRVGMPGSETNYVHTSGNGLDLFTGIPNGATQSLSASAFMEADAGADLTAENADRAVFIPMPVDFFLSTGDTVQRVLSASPNDILVQVFGVEDDA